jgi:hypothetical protein
MADTGVGCCNKKNILMGCLYPIKHKTDNLKKTGELKVSGCLYTFKKLAGIDRIIQVQGLA